MTLQQAVDAYLDEHEVGTLYAQGLRRQARKLAAVGVTHVAHLNSQAINGFLAALPLSQTSRANARREICTIWRFCHEMGWTEEYPTRVRRIRCRPQAPQAWSYLQLSSLVKRAMADDRPISLRLPSVRYCDVLPAWASLGWETGLRFADIHSLRGGDFQNRVVCIVAQKTGKVTTRAISDQTLSLCVPMLKLSTDGTLFRWALPRRRAFVVWRNFLKQAGVAGSSRWLRRSCATFVENDRPGEGARMMGHDSPSTTRRHYLDPRLMPMPEPPPPLDLR